ncbi:MAG: tetratricopeptide repeat protein [Ignavibacteriales bacterium]|nr:tetratricopeptide repeat protein [Ignavibacteriales bacterium]
MNPNVYNAIKILFFTTVLSLLLVWAGCSSSQVATEASPEQRKIDSLLTVNMDMRQRLVKLEQDNFALNSKLTESEAKVAAERERADKAAEAAKAAAPVVATPVKETPKSTESFSGYEDAHKAFAGKKYNEAIQTYQAVLDGGTGEDLADNCHYWIGESYFGLKKYDEAMKHFEMVFQYKTSEKKGDAQYMIGQCYERTGKKAEAKQAYEKVVKDYPTCDVVQKAKERWGRL